MRSPEFLNLIILIPDYQHSQTAAASKGPSDGTGSSAYVEVRVQRVRFVRAFSASSSSFLDTVAIVAEIAIVEKGTFECWERAGKHSLVSQNCSCHSDRSLVG